MKDIKKVAKEYRDKQYRELLTMQTDLQFSAGTLERYFLKKYGELSEEYNIAKKAGKFVDKEDKLLLEEMKQYEE